MSFSDRRESTISCVEAGNRGESRVAFVERQYRPPVIVASSNPPQEHARRSIGIAGLEQ